MSVNSERRAIAYFPEFSAIINQIKQNLIARREGSISDAQKYICENADNSYFLQEVLKSNLSLFLVEALVPLRSDDNSIIYECLQKFTNERVFYANGHAASVVEGVCRLGMFLLKGNSDGESLQELNAILRLLQNALVGFRIFRIVDNLPVSLLNELVVALIDRHFNRIDTMRLITSFTTTCLNFEPTMAFETHWVRFTDFFKRMTDVAEDAKLSPEIDAIIDETTCFAHALRGRLSAEDTATLKLADEMFAVFFINRALPHFMKMPAMKLSKSYLGLSALFSGIEGVLGNQDGEKLAHRFAIAHTLQFSAVIRSLAIQWDDKPLLKTTQSVLCRLLTLLSFSCFKFPKIWPWGKQSLANEIEMGVEGTPSDLMQWSSVLGDPKNHRSTKLVVLLFCYFQALLEGNLNQMLISPYLNRFLDDLQSGTVPLIFIRLTWLVTSANEVGGGHNPARNDIMMKLSVILEKVTDLELAYTHHPTVMFFILGSNAFSFNLQFKVLTQWLLQQSDDEKKILVNFLKTHSLGKPLILCLVTKGDSVVSEKAFNVIEILIKTNEDPHLSQQVGQLLLEASTALCGNLIALDSFEKIAKLVLMLPFESFGTLSTSVKFFTAAFSSIPSPSLTIWNLALHMVSNIKEQNKYAVAAFLKSENFLRKLIDALMTDSPETAQVCLTLVANLSEAQRRHNITCADVNVSFDLDKFFLHLQQTHAGCCYAAMLFTHEALVANWNWPFFGMNKTPDATGFRRLFFLILRGMTYSFEDLGWRCLKAFFENCVYNGDDKSVIHFANSYGLLLIIRSHLQYLAQYEAMSDFIIYWCSIRKPSLLSKRQMAVPQINIVVRAIAEEILKSFKLFLMPLVHKLIEGKELVGFEGIHEKLVELSNGEMEETEENPGEESGLEQFHDTLIHVENDDAICDNATESDSEPVVMFSPENTAFNQVALNSDPVSTHCSGYSPPLYLPTPPSATQQSLASSFYGRNATPSVNLECEENHSRLSSLTERTSFPQFRDLLAGNDENNSDFVKTVFVKAPLETEPKEPSPVVDVVEISEGEESFSPVYNWRRRSRRLKRLSPLTKQGKSHGIRKPCSSCD